MIATIMLPTLSGMLSINKIGILLGSLSNRVSNTQYRYLTVLMTLTKVVGNGTKHGKLLSNQFMDVIIRVNVVRSFGVKNMVSFVRFCRCGSAFNLC